MAVPIVHYEITFPDVGGPIGGYDIEVLNTVNEEWFHKEQRFIKEYPPEDLRPLNDNITLIAYNEEYELKARTFNTTGAERNYSEYSDTIRIKVGSGNPGNGGNDPGTKEKPSKPFLRVFMNTP